MAGKTILFLIILTIVIVPSGCSKKDSLEQYSDILTEADLYQVISYSGTLEKQVTKNREGVHLIFATEGYFSTNGNRGDRVFIAHVEHMAADEEALKNDMKNLEPLSNIGNYAWYDNYGNGYHEIFFYTADNKIIAQLGGHTEKSNHDPSTFIDKYGLQRLAKLVENRL